MPENRFTNNVSVFRGLIFCVLKVIVRNDCSYHHSESCCLGRSYDHFLILFEPDIFGMPTVHSYFGADRIFWLL